MSTTINIIQGIKPGTIKITGYKGVGITGYVPVNLDIELVVIGTQTWMKYNINKNITGSKVYGNTEANRSIYGGLYDFSMIAAIEAAYPGYHVPTKAEFQTLITFLDPSAGGKLKETGTTHWQTPNTGATNATGFTALPGGRYTNAFVSIGINGYFLTSTVELPVSVWYRYFKYDSASDSEAADLQTYFLSVRLIKD
jgi:uncharacterized protein (TIGR02145 family)